MVTQIRPELVGAHPSSPGPRRGRRTAIGLVLLLLVAGVAAVVWWPEPKVDVRAGTTLVTRDGLAARYGIDVTLVGVSARGGLIDFRYQVVDPDKANPLIHDPALFPKLIAEDTGATVGMRSLPHNHGASLELGGSYFFLLPNANNALRRQSLVTLVIGDARLEHLVVQG